MVSIYTVVHTMRTTLQWCSVVGVGMLMLLSNQDAFAEEKKLRVVGWIEKVRIEAVDAVLRAKMDTGAKTSSLHAEIIDVQAPEDWDERTKNPGRVIFRINDEEGNPRTFERDVTRWVRIKARHNEDALIVRPVIMMEFCFAGVRLMEEVNLANREQFTYPVLIGRNMLEHAKVAIDASRTYVVRPNCPIPVTKEPQKESALHYKPF